MRRQRGAHRPAIVELFKALVLCLETAPKGRGTGWAGSGKEAESAQWLKAGTRGRMARWRRHWLELGDDGWGGPGGPVKAERARCVDGPA
jgi:hypothetical protein